jgi:alpha-L-fucosidase
MPNGKIQDEHKERLKAIGEWLQVYGETIYGSRQGSVSVEDELVSTRKGDKLYLHVLESSGEELLISDFDHKIKEATFFKDKTAVSFKLKKGELKLIIPEDKKEEIDTVIEITLK